MTAIPRNGSGIYSPPAGTAGVPAQPISSTAYNAYVTDNGSEITNSLPVTGVRAMQANLPMGGNRITALADPVAAQDASTKNYVDTSAAPASAGAFLGGTSTGTANAQVIASTTPAAFAKAVGYRIVFIPGFTNAGALTLAVTSPSIPATNVFKIGPAGAVACTGGEVVAGEITEAICDGTNYVLVTNATVETGPLTSLASATTTDLGTIGSRNVNITGTTTITSFGSSAAASFPLYFLTFAGILTLTHNATSLILPGAASIVTAAGDTAIALDLGSGNWRVVNYTKASGLAVVSQAAPDLWVRDEEPSGTSASNSASSAYATRTLNTVIRNVLSGASLSSNHVVLPAGTYYAEWHAPAQSLSSIGSTLSQTRLRNTTDSTTVGNGQSNRSFAAASSFAIALDSDGADFFTLTGTKNIELQHFLTSGGNYGTAASTGEVEVFAELQIWKVS